VAKRHRGKGGSTGSKERPGQRATGGSGSGPGGPGRQGSVAGGGASEPASAGAPPRPTPPVDRTAAQVAVDWGKSLALAVVLFLVLRTFLVQTFVITSSSMEDTLMVGDFLILSKLAYGPQVPFSSWRLPGYTSPERGDIAVFRPPHDPDLDVVKRLVGAPGDTLLMSEKVLYINGVPANEPYVRHSDFEGDVGHPWMRWQCGDPVALGPDISGAYRIPPGTPTGPAAEACFPTRDNWGPIVIPDGYFFTIGDNRDDSVDSRHWGFLDAELLRGEALIIYYSYDPRLRRPFAFLRNIRPDRIGSAIR
jgi:signal peptidase I